LSFHASIDENSKKIYYHNFSTLEWVAYRTNDILSWYLAVLAHVTVASFDLVQVTELEAKNASQQSKLSRGWLEGLMIQNSPALTPNWGIGLNVQ
jgi:hypothetical protein